MGKRLIKMGRLSDLFVNETSTIKEAMKIIDKGEIKTAIVVDNNKKLLGMIGDGDIRRGILKGIEVHESVSKVMNKNPIFLFLNSPKEELIRVIKEKKIIGIPLVDNNKIVKDFVLFSNALGLIYLDKTQNPQKHLNRILVIGGGGYIGSILTRKLLSKGYKVNILDNFTYSKNPIKEIESNPNLNVFEGDTRHIEDITKSIDDVDAVVHLAELVGDPVCALNPCLTQEVNYLATKTVASICKHFQINRLVYTSSCSVYGASKGDELLNENSSLNPISLYAKMKIASENALMEFKDENFMPTILRLATVFGFSYRPRFDLVVNLLTAKAMQEKNISVFGGDQWRPNVHVEDVADTIIKVLESPIEKVGGQIFNVGSDENNHTILAIGELVKKNIPEATLTVSEENVDKRDYKVNFSKLKNTLKINMKKKVENGIIEVKSALEKNPIDYKDKKYHNVKFMEEKI